MRYKHKNEIAMAEEHSGLAQPRNALRQIRHFNEMSYKHKNETAMAEEHSGLAEPRNALRQIRHLEQQQENVHRENGID